MPDPADQSKDELREGTETLQSIADDVEAEREQSSARWTVPGDDGSADDEAETREDHDEGDTNFALNPRLDEEM